MKRDDHYVYLTQTVEAFRQALVPADTEAFNEALIQIYLDPRGKKSGRVVERIRPPLVFYVYTTETFVFLYHLRKRLNEERERVAVFDVSWTSDL